MSVFRFLVLFFSLIALFQTSNLFAKADNGKLQFLTIADIHVDTSNSPTQECVPGDPALKREPMQINPSNICEGYPRKNDSEIKTFGKMLSAIKADISLGQPVGFIIILGDFASHARPSKNFKGNSVSNDIKTGFKMTYDAFPNIPMFYVFGNNDSLGDEPNSLFYYDDSAIDSENNSPYEIAIYKNTGWSDGFLSTGIYCGNTTISQYPCLITESMHRKEAYYAAYIKPKLKLVVLNTVMMSRLGILTISKIIDGGKKAVVDKGLRQLKWFESQLKSSRKNNESVVIVMHIPPGLVTYKKGESAGYLNDELGEKLIFLFHKYEPEIATIISGHGRYDEFKIIVDAKGNIVGDLIIITPPMSTADGTSPGVQYYFLHRKKNRWILDSFETLRFDRREGGRLSLSTLYDFKSRYCMGKGDYSELDECVEGVSKEKLAKSIMSTFTLGNPNIGNKAIINNPNAIYIKIKEVFDQKDSDKGVKGIFNSSSGMINKTNSALRLYKISN